MEFLARLRTVWTIICLIGAALIIFAYTMAPRPHPAYFVLAAACVIAGFSFHVPGSWRVKVSVLWFGGLGLANLAMMVDDAQKSLGIFTGMVALWLAAAAAVFVVGGLTGKSSRISGTD